MRRQTTGPGPTWYIVRYRWHPRRGGRAPLDPGTIARVGAALVRVHGGPGRRVLIGRDTRESGSWIESALAHGLSSEGAEVASAGVVPTPAVAYLTKTDGFDLGVVISASHNPYHDNGIKVFSGAGEKFTEAEERAVEAMVADSGWAVAGDGRAGSAARPISSPATWRTCGRCSPTPAACAAPGSSSIAPTAPPAAIAPALFAASASTSTRSAWTPDGRNINLACGSTAMEALQARVPAAGARLGVAFDGDGDRALFVDHRGRRVDGDAVMLICADQLRREGQLAGDALVATVMSNIGLELALKDRGIALVRCPVGDKYVMEEMLKRGLALGGEQSGHVIFAEHLFTGDGMATALFVLRAMAATGRELADLAASLTAYPQVLLNVRVRERVGIDTVPEIARAMRVVESRLDGHGRLLVRYSGTEPLLRIMLEGRDQAEIQAWAEEIAAAVRTHLG